MRIELALVRCGAVFQPEQAFVHQIGNNHHTKATGRINYVMVGCNDNTNEGQNRIQDIKRLQPNENFTPYKHHTNQYSPANVQT